MANLQHSDRGTSLAFEQILIGGAWQRDVALHIAADGTIASVSPTGVRQDPAPSVQTTVAGWTVPGLSNVHSHAFQRALVGLAERGGQGSFWSWREVMYDFLLRLTPEQVEVIAAQLYVELLKGGFTCVGEFHYLHHQPDGRPYDDPAEISHRIISAAQRARIGLVHIPVVYETGGFDGGPLAGGQKRFQMDPDGAAELVATLTRGRGAGADLSLGWGVHSLRACTPEGFEAAAQSFASVPDLPVHIHVSEQEREVDECLAARGARPIEWLLDNADVGPGWCLIHGTHGTAAELTDVARRGACMGLCPTTEADLGDGVFQLPGYLSSAGAFGVGTDSHVGTTAAGELRCLEYGQRLSLRRRGIVTPPKSGGEDVSGVGGALYTRALEGGAPALGRPNGRVETGMPADFVVLDGDHPALVGRGGAQILDSWVFSGAGNPVRDVMVGGRWVIQDGHHPEEDKLQADFGQTMRALLSGL